MFEKVNPGHPDKVADRIAGAVVDLCYTKNKNPKVACEVLIGHGECNIQVETSEQISAEDIGAIVERIAGEDIETPPGSQPAAGCKMWRQRHIQGCAPDARTEAADRHRREHLRAAPIRRQVHHPGQRPTGCTRLRRDYLPKSSEPWAGAGTARASEERLRHPPAHDQPAGRVDGRTEHGQRCDEQETWQRYGRRSDRWRLDGQGLVEV